MVEKNLKATAPVTRHSGVKRRLLPILDSYLFWGFMGSMMRGLCWFSGLFLAFAVVSGAQKIAQNGVPFMAAMEAIALQMPRIILFTIPASLLFGAVSNFVEMSAKGETTAIMAGGMSVPRLMRAPMMLTILLAFIMFWLQESVVPGAELRKGTLMLEAASKMAKQEGFRFADYRPDGTYASVIQAKSFDPQQKVLIEPRIQIYGKNNTVEIEIVAESGLWDDKENVWKFQNGFNRFTPSNKSENPIRNVFSEWTIKTDMAPTPSKMKNVVRSAREQIERKNYEMVSWQQLKVYRTEKLAEFAKSKGAERKVLRKQVRSLTYGIHDKFAMPFVALAMVLVGIPLGIRPQRTASPGMAMGLSLIVMLGYYLFWVLCSNVGKGGIALPELVAYLPVIVLFIIGSILIVKKS